jgi:hypothetical protein
MTPDERHFWLFVATFEKVTDERLSLQNKANASTLAAAAMMRF